MVEEPSNKEVKQRKETSATARRRFPPVPRLPSPSSTPATYTVALELVSEALTGYGTMRAPAGQAARSGRAASISHPGILAP